MAKIQKSEKSEDKANEEQTTEKIQQIIETKVNQIKPEPKKITKVKVDKSKSYKCHGLFIKVSFDEICWNYADGKYSKNFLKSKGMKCPRK